MSLGRIFVGGVVLGLVVANATLQLKGIPPDGDPYQNYLGAIHLYRHHTFDLFSLSDQATPSFYREPGYPTLLALGVYPLFRGHLPPFERMLPEPPENAETVYQLLYVNVFVFVITLLCIQGITETLSGSWVTSQAAVLIFGFCPRVLEWLNAYYSEAFAGLLVLIAGWLLFDNIRRPGRRRSAAMLGLTLGVLTLTRAVFFYFLPIALGLVFIEYRRQKVASAVIRGWLVTAFLPMLFLVGGWMARNHHWTGRWYLAERGGFVLYERTYFLNQSPNQFLPYLLSWTPLDIAKETLERRYHTNYTALQQEYYRVTNYQRYRFIQQFQSTARADAALANKALRRIAASPIAFVLDIPAFLYRGLFFWNFWGSLALLFGGVTGLVGLSKLAPRQMYVFAPGIFSFLFCSILTTNTPRYHIALIPQLVISLSLLGHRVYRRIAKHVHSFRHRFEPHLESP
jgi:4-amino-4-deoxy-L-arabinose transferase-like glycosyltransferase